MLGSYSFFHCKVSAMRQVKRLFRLFTTAFFSSSRDDADEVVCSGGIFRSRVEWKFQWLFLLTFSIIRRQKQKVWMALHNRPRPIISRRDVRARVCVCSGHVLCWRSESSWHFGVKPLGDIAHSLPASSCWLLTKEASSPYVHYSIQGWGKKKRSEWKREKRFPFLVYTRRARGSAAAAGWFLFFFFVSYLSTTAEISTVRLPGRLALFASLFSLLPWKCT